MSVVTLIEIEQLAAILLRSTLQRANPRDARAVVFFTKSQSIWHTQFSIVEPSFNAGKIGRAGMPGGAGCRPASLLGRGICPSTTMLDLSGARGERPERRVRRAPDSLVGARSKCESVCDPSADIGFSRSLLRGHKERFGRSG